VKSGKFELGLTIDDVFNLVAYKKKVIDISFFDAILKNNSNENKNIILYDEVEVIQKRGILTMNEEIYNIRLEVIDIFKNEKITEL